MGTIFCHMLLSFWFYQFEPKHMTQGLQKTHSSSFKLSKHSQTDSYVNVNFTKGGINSCVNSNNKEHKCK